MSIELTLNSPQLDDEGLQELTQQLCQAIDNETDTRPQLVASEGRQGMKSGEIVSLGAIAFAFFSSGGCGCGVAGNPESLCQP